MYVEFGGREYQQTVDIRMGDNCAPWVADLLVYSYEADLVQLIQKSKFNKPTTNHFISRFAIWMMLWY